MFSEHLWTCKTTLKTLQRFTKVLNFFLHGYGRYVCREAQVTLIEFKEKAEKIRARITTKHSKQTQQPNKNPTQTKPGSYLLRTVKIGAKI